MTYLEENADQGVGSRGVGSDDYGFESWRSFTGLASVQPRRSCCGAFLARQSRCSVATDSMIRRARSASKPSSRAPGAKTLQVVLTYRDAPVEGAEADLISTMEHSVLGLRSIYNGTSDAVAVACFRRALLGEQQQAVEEVWDNGQRVGARQPTIRLSVVPGQPPEADAVPVIATDLDLLPKHSPGPRLRAEWSDGRCDRRRYGPRRPALAAVKARAPEWRHDMAAADWRWKDAHLHLPAGVIEGHPRRPSLSRVMGWDWLLGEESRTAEVSSAGRSWWTS